MGILALISGLFAQLFASSALYFIALKLVLAALFITVLPIVLNNFFKAILDGIFSIVTTQAGGAESIGLAFTGLAGWGLGALGAPGAFAVIVSAIAFRFALRLIPFVRL